MAAASWWGGMVSRLFLGGGGGGPIGHAGQHLPDLAGDEIHPLGGVNNFIRLVHQDDVAVPAHNLADQGGFHLVPQVVHRLKDDAEHPVQALLPGGDEPAGAQVLAQQHTEHRGGLGVFQRLGGKVDLGGGGVGREEEPAVLAAAPEGQKHQLPAGLADFIDAGAGQGVDLLADFMEKASVKGHGECHLSL